MAEEGKRQTTAHRNAHRKARTIGELCQLPVHNKEHLLFCDTNQGVFSKEGIKAARQHVQRGIKKGRKKKGKEVSPYTISPPSHDICCADIFHFPADNESFRLYKLLE
jgi:hypothetical protein